jgi:molybdopterin-guanine dinucleotide biosynthesis protein A
VEELLARSELSLQGLPRHLGAEEIPFDRVRPHDPEGRSFLNVNSPEDLQRLSHRIDPREGK